MFANVCEDKYGTGWIHAQSALHCPGMWQPNSPDSECIEEVCRMTPNCQVEFCINLFGKF